MHFLSSLYCLSSQLSFPACLIIDKDDSWDWSILRLFSSGMTLIRTHLEGPMGRLNRSLRDLVREGEGLIDPCLGGLGLNDLLRVDGGC